MAKYDWTAMYVMHNALRCELEHLAKLADRAAMLSVLPEPARTAYKTDWHPTYTTLNRWNVP